MKLNRTIFFLIIFIQLFILACSKCQSTEEISGSYRAGIDGYVPNQEIIDNGMQSLLLLSDNTFILYEARTSENGAISGKWEIKSCKNIETSTHPYVESILEFTIKNRKTKAKCLGGRKIIFDHPEEFYGDKNKILKYSKLSETI